MITFTKDRLEKFYEDLPTAKKNAVVEFTIDKIVIDETKLSATELAKAQAILAKHNYTQI